MRQAGIVGVAVAALVIGAAVGSYVSSPAEGAPEVKQSLAAKVADLEARVAKLEKERGTIFVTNPSWSAPQRRCPSPLPGAEPHEINGMTYYILPVGPQSEPGPQLGHAVERGPTIAR